MKTASEILRQAIVDSGLSLYDLKRMSGVDPATTSRFLNGKATLTLPTFDKLAAAVGVQVLPPPAKRKVTRRSP